ncbi:MAG: class I SAM-dependent methyltransferase [Actinomycetota bacterium]|nr:class I SAM-dependent methyltransferase [Actinomycetota bacterium]MDA2950979.1 class I SAM-dependent methyltransferase [Actinomycetota bacterium]
MRLRRRRLAELRDTAAAAGVGDRLTAIVSDAREPLPLPDASMDAVYSHMLFNMALSTPQLQRLAAEIHRVLRPGGLHVYTNRHVGDAHYGEGTQHGDDMFENGGIHRALLRPGTRRPTRSRLPDSGSNLRRGGRLTGSSNLSGQCLVRVSACR